jgi:hypothetical protein
MLLFAVSLVDNIFWKIRRNDPVKQHLPSLPGCFFINPLLYPQLELRTAGLRMKPLGIADDVVILQTDGIVLGTNLEQIDATLIPFAFEPLDFFGDAPPDPSFTAVIAYVERLTSVLRQISRQVDIPKGLAAIERTERAELPEVDFPHAAVRGGCALQKYLCDTAITREHLLAADAEIVNKTIPVHEIMLLDAIHALKEHDYRRAILYAAISIEIVAATKLSDVYKTIVTKAEAASALRIISRVQARGELTVKDPVYEFLFEKSRLSERLHEVPLYLIGRSLLEEDETLYQGACRLYRTRNKIAHSGEPPLGDQGCFEINEKDAYTSVECAVQVMCWFGEEAEFPLPKSGFVRLDSLEAVDIQ